MMPNKRFNPTVPLNGLWYHQFKRAAQRGLTWALGRGVRMDLPDARQNLRALVADGLSSAERSARSELAQETLYAITLYSTTGFQGLCVAANTYEALNRTRSRGTEPDAELLEMLKAHPDLMAKVDGWVDPDPEVCAWQWEYFYSNSQLDNAGRLIDSVYDYFHNHGYSVDSIADWFFESLSSALQDFVATLPNDNGLLLGMQFTDPGADDINKMERASEQVNSPFWHAKVLTACNVIRATS